MAEGSAEVSRNKGHACSVETCERPAECRGMCGKHYSRWRASGDPLVVRKPGPKPGAKPPRTCLVEDCEKPYFALGLCGMHYGRQRDHGEVGDAKPRRPRRYNGEACSVDGCERDVASLGYCSMHWQRVHDKGDPGPAEPLRLAGSRRRNPKSGYVYISRGGRRRAEHIWVMEDVLGRRLLPFEEVHHKNGIRDDNDPDNLELKTKPHGAGQRPIDLAEWVVKYYPEAVRAALDGEVQLRLVE